jgi:hypothetical protein
MVTSFVIHRTGNLWQKLVGKDYLLLIDGQEHARITTRLEETNRNRGEFDGASRGCICVLATV